MKREKGRRSAASVDTKAVVVGGIPPCMQPGHTHQHPDQEFLEAITFAVVAVSVDVLLGVE